MAQYEVIDEFRVVIATRERLRLNSSDLDCGTVVAGKGCSSAKVDKIEESSEGANAKG